jgi:3-oxoacyl-[acyl-carrier-protein] synthase III
MAAKAARKALGSGPPPDLILNASTTPRQLIPDTAAFVQQELGYSGVPSYTIHATCLSFLVGLHTAALHISAGAARRVLVVSSEIGSPGRDMRDPESAVLIGDGAAAAIVVPTPAGEPSEFVAWRMATWPEGAEFTELRGFGQRCHPSNLETRPADQLFRMDGRSIFKMVRKPFREALNAVLAEHSLTYSDIDLVVPHQASGPALEHLRRLTDFRSEQVVNIVAEYGNCIAASLPMALAHAHQAGRLKRGMRVLMVGTGAGLSMACALLRW